MNEAMEVLRRENKVARKATPEATLVILCMRFTRKVPGSIAALLLSTSFVVAFGISVETIGTRFGGIPSGLPAISVPQFHSEMIPALLSPALTIALSGAIESLMSAMVADRISGNKHNPNVELVAQGIANIAVPFFGGIPATGAIARTATSIRSGAKTPVAGIVHALTLLAVLLFAAPLAQHSPLAVLSAILLVVSYNMSEWREIPRLILCGARPQPAKFLRQADFEQHVGRENVCPHFTAALERAKGVFEKPTDLEVDQPLAHPTAVS